MKPILYVIFNEVRLSPKLGWIGVCAGVIFANLMYFANDKDTSLFIATAFGAIFGALVQMAVLCVMFPVGWYRMLRSHYGFTAARTARVLLSALIIGAFIAGSLLLLLHFLNWGLNAAVGATITGIIMWICLATAFYFTWKKESTERGICVIDVPPADQTVRQIVARK